MADGAITFSTALDNEQLEKDIKRTEKEIANLKRKIEEGSDDRSYLKEKLDSATEAAKKAREELERLNYGMGTPGGSKELAQHIREAEKEAKGLRELLDDKTDKRTGMEEELRSINEDIETTKRQLQECVDLYEQFSAKERRLASVSETGDATFDGAISMARSSAAEQAAEAKANISQLNRVLAQQEAEQFKVNAGWKALGIEVGDYKRRLDLVNASISEMRELLTRAQGAESALKQQEQEAAQLERRWKSTDEKVKEYQRDLERATMRQKELGEEHARTYTKAGSAAAAGMERARRATDQFSSRVNTMIKRVFVYGAILKGVRAVASGLSDALRENQRFSASWENLKATITGVANAIANLVAPALTGMVNAATAAIQTLARAVDRMFGTNVMQAIAAARAAAEAAWRQTDASKAAQEAIDGQARSTRRLAREQAKATKTLLAFDEVNALQAETAADAADALGDEAEGLADPESLMKPDWGAFDVGRIGAKLAEIMMLLGASIMAVGAILCFSGVNIPLGITLMVVGALLAYTAYREQWDKLPAEVQASITTLLGVIGAALIVLGVVLCVTGFLPLGIGFIIAGAGLFATAVALDWDSLKGNVDGALDALKMLIGAMIAVVGVVLCLTGHVPLGIAAIIAGIAVFAVGAAGVDWGSMPPRVADVTDRIAKVLWGALVVLGAVLCATGHIPLGVAAIIAGIGLFGVREALVDPDAASGQVSSMISLIAAAVGPFISLIGLVLLAAGFIPMGVALLLAGIAVFGVGAVELDEGAVPEEVMQMVNTVLLVGTALTFVLGVVLCAAGLVPMGIALLLASGFLAITAFAVNYKFIEQKVREVWEGIKRYWNQNIAPVTKAEWWAQLGKNMINGLIGRLNDGLRAAGGFLNTLGSGIAGIMNWVFPDGGWWFKFDPPQIPYLAQGAVIPPNREFMAVLGDQAHGNNIETPEALMRQVVREEAVTVMASLMASLAASGDGPMGGDTRDIVLMVGRDELARVTVRGMRDLDATGELGGLGLSFV